jgi:F0F1-type ATP synthase membrane subunit b/b'
MTTDTTPELAELHAALADAEHRLADAEEAVSETRYDLAHDEAYDFDLTDRIEAAADVAREVESLKAQIAEYTTGPDCGA